ncbi:type IV pilus secretin PilQ [Paludibacterium purpuratum]|uniref:Type IV pilus biogenesis and competence protein PilQ n=1 Tax=Paludibacterium purpuratum TaxID=1144873 RepID=A0A4R7BAT9_9NEIS|nr:type IV pilus secretin PilQ [Paludibacterium purpuratum]TDR80777.1 type IV pilus secretin PilQ/predicted competence protein [Paludibacterium purpuratum]
MIRSRRIGMASFYLGWLTANAMAANGAAPLSLNFQNMEVSTALYALADHAGRDIIVNDSVKGQITLRLNGVRWDQAIELILQAKGLERQTIGKVMHISKRDELLGQDKQRFEAGQQRQALVAPQVRAFPLRHRPAAEVRKLLEEGRLLSDKGSMLVDPGSNTLFVHDIPSSGDKIKQFVESTDRPLRQVMIEARIVEANDFFSRELGSKLHFARVPDIAHRASTLAGWRDNDTPGSTADHDGLSAGVNLPIQPPFGSIAALFRASAGTLIGLELQAMQAEGQGKVVSSPRLLAADRSEASIEEGSEIPYPRSRPHRGSRDVSSVEFKKAALSLKVKPVIAPDARSLWIEIDISKDSPNYKQSVLGAPSVDTKRIRTSVQIENGGTVVLGGIYIDEQHNLRNHVPILGDIPLLGALFSSKTKRHSRRELLVFITPQIISRS